MSISMKSEFNQLKELYGNAPKKGIAVEDMQARVYALGEQMDEILEERGHELRHLREFKKGFSDLESRANMPEIYRKRAGGYYIDAWTNLLDRNFEWLERVCKQDEINRRSAKEWRELERAYIVKSRYTLWDFYDDYKTMIEESTLLLILRLQIFGVDAWKTLDLLVTWDDYREERKKWRLCKHRFCLEIFPVKSGHFKEDDSYFEKRREDARFCCQRCRKGEYESKQQYMRTEKMYDNPTYLPQEEINKEFELDISVQDKAAKREVSYEQEEELDALNTGTLKHVDFKEESERELRMRSKDEERRARYEAFIRGEGEGVLKVKIKDGEEVMKEKENIKNSEKMTDKRSTHRIIYSRESA